MASVTLDFDSGHIDDPLEPDIDDLGRTNVVVASRRSGGEATDADTTGPLGTDTIGIYRSRVDINPESDTDLPQHAHHHLTLGTDPDPRYPVVPVDLDANPDLAATVSALDIGDRLSMSTLPADLGQPEADTLVLGYTEVIGSHRRTIAFNTRPGGILTHVGQLDGGASACLQTAGAELTADITAEQTSFDVATTSGPLFTTTPPTGARIEVNGREVMTVTGVTSAVKDPFTRSETDGWGSSPEGYTYLHDVGSASDYSVNGSQARMLASTANVQRRARAGPSFVDGRVRCNLIPGVVATGASFEQGLILRRVDASNFYAAEVRFLVGGTMNLRFVRTLSGSGASIANVNLPGGYGTTTVMRLIFEIEGSTLRAKAWNFNDSEPAFWQLVHEDSNVTAAGQAGASLRVQSGNTNVPLTVGFDDFEIVNPQTFTVTRDPDQRMTHSSGASVDVYRALRLTL